MWKKYKNLIFIVLLLFLLFIGIIIYSKYPIYVNKKNLMKYLNDNNYKLEDYYIYTSTQKDNDTTTISKLLYDNYYFTKCVIKSNNNETIKTNYYYTKNKEIIIEYEQSTTIGNEFKMNVINGIYKNNELTQCNKILGDLDCNDLLTFAKNYEEEINNIITAYNLDLDILNKINLNNYHA